MDATILVVDDSRLIRDFFADSVLRPAGYTVLTAPEGTAGLRLAQSHRPDLIIADLQMPGLSGLELKSALAAAGDNTPVILITAEGSENIASQAMLAGVSYYLPKPVDVDVMLAAIGQALTVERLRRERAEALAALERRVHQLETLQTIGRALTASLDLDQVLVSVVEAAVRLTAADGGALYLLDDRGAQLALRTVLRADEGGARPADEPAADALAARVARTNQPEVWRPPVDQPPQTSVPAGPALYVPLRLREEMFGVLAVDSRRGGRALDETEVGPLSTLADHAAIAIANARLFARLQLQSTTDDLTGLYNRRHLLSLAEREFRRVRRFNRALSTIMLDIDHFKQVNDTYGHAAGDDVIAEVARRLRTNIRSIDLIGRYGGEEFVLVLPETGLAGARLVAERLRRAIALTPVPTAADRLPITISLGVADAQADVGELAALIARADQAMYAAKQAGRNRVLIYPART
ncbi:MAG: diguanylate cyclase [Anaerolineales bacterium]|nr:diguanylate cyclase [Anaerolineales bacterium]